MGPETRCYRRGRRISTMWTPKLAQVDGEATDDRGNCGKSVEITDRYSLSPRIVRMRLESTPDAILRRFLTMLGLPVLRAVDDSLFTFARHIKLCHEDIQQTVRELSST